MVGAVTGNDVVFTGDAAVDTVTFTVDGTGNLQHNLPVLPATANAFNSSIDLDSAQAGDQILLASSITNFTYTDATQGDSVTLNASLLGLVTGNVQAGNIGGSGSITTTTGLNINSTGAVAGSNTLSGVLGGAGALAKTGAGRLVLSNTNTLTGNVVLTGGTIAVSADGTGNG
ncbi:MAG: hypothetical protein U0894_17465 [Pirellulales bacterium]